MCGLTAAGELRRAGWDVTVVDKGRMPGGRMATREFAGGSFDYGAQFFTVRSPEFREQADAWERSGITHVWTHGFARPNGAYKPDGHPRYCGIEGMNAIPRSMAAELLQGGVTVECHAKVGHLEWSGRQWHADTPKARYSADVLILTSPVPQSLQLLDQSGIEVSRVERRYLDAARYERCLSVLLQTDGRAQLPDPGAIIDSDFRQPISFLSDNSRKNISSLAGSLTIHSNWEEAAQLWDDPLDQTSRRFAECAKNLVGAFSIVEAYVHRWKYSKPVSTFDFRAMTCHQPGPMVFAGDIFSGAKVEGAFLSGLEAARQACATA